MTIQQIIDKSKTTGKWETICRFNSNEDMPQEVKDAPKNSISGACFLNCETMEWASSPRVAAKWNVCVQFGEDGEVTKY